MHWESADLPSHRSRLTQEEIDRLIAESPIPLRQFDSDGIEIDWETWARTHTMREWAQLMQDATRLQNPVQHSASAPETHEEPE